MAGKENSRLITKFARQGKLEGEGGVRQLLIENLKMAADIDFCEPPYNRTALWEATWRNHEAIVKLLVDKGAQVTFADFQGRTPLHEAAFYGHVNLVEYFLEKGHPIDVVDNFGQSPLFRAVEGGRHEVVQFLVEKKAQTNMLDGYDVNVGHVAAFGGMPSMSQWLLYEGSWKNRFMADDISKRQALQDKKTTTGKDGQEGAPKEGDEEDGAVTSTQTMGRRNSQPQA
eukprot:TRINITY_DN12204_c0_g1_i1.p2 TRINITY_DN12204_c0_g1~~TRINITY_DN12204_c0_g1_i1.p2  ORF type:complete len:228 (+),score=73.99 TRINITY_DN12204_c0_g1_i1:87-770(+)